MFDLRGNTNSVSVLIPCYTRCVHGHHWHRSAQRDCGYWSLKSTTSTRACSLFYQVTEKLYSQGFFSHSTALKNWQSCAQMYLFTSHAEVALLIASQVISRAPPRCFPSDAARRCGWDLTSIGFLMTVLFVLRVPPRKADVWQEIAVEEDWAPCWAGLLSRCPARYALLLHSPFPPFTLTPSLNCPLWARNGIV